MGKRARASRERTQRVLRVTRLTDEEKASLRKSAFYEGSPYHKREPRDFGLSPPANPRPDATLCDEAGDFDLAIARQLFAEAIDHGLVSASTTGTGFPKQLWVVQDGRVFEAMYGGSRTGAYHGYPIRRTDPLFGEVLAAWSRT